MTLLESAQGCLTIAHCCLSYPVDHHIPLCSPPAYCHCSRKHSQKRNRPTPELLVLCPASVTRPASAMPPVCKSTVNRGETAVMVAAPACHTAEQLIDLGAEQNGNPAQIDELGILIVEVGILTRFLLPARHSPEWAAPRHFGRTAFSFSVILDRPI